MACSLLCLHSAFSTRSPQNKPFRLIEHIIVFLLVTWFFTAWEQLLQLYKCSGWNNMLVCQIKSETWSFIARGALTLREGWLAFHWLYYRITTHWKRKRLPYLLATKSDKDEGEKSFKECLCSYPRALEAEQKKASVDSSEDVQSVKPGKFLFQLLAQGGGGRGHRIFEHLWGSVKPDWNKNVWLKDPF